jgi:Tat protein secretion system quality control protein TatD with DNase activity
VLLTVEALAEARGEDPEELGARIDANASAAFSLP